MRATLETPRGQVVVAKILAAVAAGPATSAQIAERVHLHPTYVQQLIALMRQGKLLHIGQWSRPETGRAVAMYAAGDAPDKAKPRPLTQSQVQKRFRRRMKRERPEQYIAVLQKARAARLRPRRDVAAAWIEGGQA